MIFVRDLVIPCSIGIHRHEQGAPQRVRITLDLAVADARPLDDRIAAVISYDDLVAGIEAIAGTGHVNLVETLAERIAEFALRDGRARAVRVRVEKLDAIAEVGAVGVEIRRRR